MTLNKSTTKLTAPSLSNLCLSSILIFASFAQYAHADGAGKILKWKDEKGVTHYGDSVPVQYLSHENSEINRQGITTKHNKAANTQVYVSDAAKQEQDRKDKALLNAFGNENEIDIARDRNLQPEQVALETLSQDKINRQKKLLDFQKNADNLTKAKKPVPARLSDDIRTNQATIAKLDQQITEKKLSMEAIRKRFDDDKKHYIALKNSANQ